MRATDPITGAVGDLTLDHCVTLRNNNSQGPSGKFYQIFRVSFIVPGVKAKYFVVTNWGPGTEAPVHSDIRGGSQLTAEYASMTYAVKKVDALRDGKLRGGYLFYSEYTSHAGVEPPAGVVAHCKLKQVADTTPQQAPASAAAKPATPVGNQKFTAQVGKVVQLASRGDLIEAIAARRTLLTWLGDMKSQLSHCEGEMEMVDAIITQRMDVASG